MPEQSQEPLLSSPQVGLSVTGVQNGAGLSLVVGLKTTAECVLHWGLSGRTGGPWERPPEACWPAGTTPAEGPAVRTPLASNGNGEKKVTIHLGRDCPARGLAFVLHFPRENRWVNGGGRDFLVRLPKNPGGPASPEAALAAWAPQPGAVRSSFPLDNGARLAAAVWTTADAVHVRLAADADAPLLLHWGVAPLFRHEWVLPPADARPAGTAAFDKLAVRTPFTEREGLQYLELKFPRAEGRPGPRGLRSVLFQPENTWLKSGGHDLYLPLGETQRDPRISSPRAWDLAEQIIGAEKGANSWTLMHRYNLCYELLDKAQDDEEALALLFAWLRYSAIRQLDWQRNYNTKPRDLSHAQDRLTTRLAALWKRSGPGRLWARLMLTTLGRGADGQRVRDEILQIMHRNGLKETSGVFVEEWHQKLHNNTTPDDVVICAAYLAFLRSGGDKAVFYKTLEQGGVTRQRLQGFERPIRTDPEFYADKRDALVKEFENFLRILKSVHSGTDLETAADVARGRLSVGLRQQLDGLLALRLQAASARQTAATAVAVREGLRDALKGTPDDAGVRDLLLLDLALEDFQRGVIERQDLKTSDRDRLADLAGSALRGLALSVDDPEPGLCAGHWEALRNRPRDGKDWALHARSVAERAARWVQGFTSHVYAMLQPRAEFLGAAFGAEAWTVPLFSEEVIRGGPAFAPALLLRPLDPILRRAAGLGGWQVISPAAAFGKVRVAGRLIDVQGERFTEPTVLLTDAVAGNEEIPTNVTAVLTTDAPDLVSHLAVRARNVRVLFATCYEPTVYQDLKNLKDRTIALQVTPGGDVIYEEAQEPGGQKAKRSASQGKRRGPAAPVAPSPSGPWVVRQEQFTPAIVGGKSNNLNALRGRLPDWIRLPGSLALPFGSFERTLDDAANRALKAKYQEMRAAAEQDPAAVLPRVRELLLQTEAPAALKQALLAAWPGAGLPPTPWEQVWRGVTRVWASKWNERAYLSRRAAGIPHDRLTMAVLVQQVVPAEYAFVIHTANPLTGNRGEVFAEVVLGLGETLVGNYPGRALGFIARKADLGLDVVSYPGKSVGLYGKGVIFRSDSNGEDLEDFAGAGLYDSVLAEEPEARLLDYRNERLVWDANFREGLLRAIARIGLEVEKVLGTPQDIEGAVAGGQFYVVQTRPQVGLNGG